eukprot:m.63455 g.63455  ORF g.63455 m.63455 type:complete len:78 (-) comp15838_c0_seq1:485-718(-)
MIAVRTASPCNYQQCTRGQYKQCHHNDDECGVSIEAPTAAVFSRQIIGSGTGQMKTKCDDFAITSAPKISSVGITEN